MKVKTIIFSIFINFILVSYGQAKTIEFCQTIVSETLKLRNYPTKGKIFTQLQPICVLDNNGNPIFKMLMYANKNNDANDVNRVKIINEFLRIGHSAMCKQQDIKELMNIIDLRVGIRLEEDVKEIGLLELNINVCKNF
jgi:hypothetical protein